MVTTVVVDASFTATASAAAGFVGYATLRTNPAIARVTNLLVPQTQTWLIDDLYITAAASAGLSDPIVKVIKNETNILADTPPLTALLVTNNSRPKTFAKILGFEGMSYMTNQIISTVANDTTAEVIRWFLTGAVNQK